MTSSRHWPEKTFQRGAGEVSTGIRKERINPTGPFLIALLAVPTLLALACGSNSGDVASLESTENERVEEATVETTSAVLDDEAALMAFTQCMRDQGIEYKDPVVDAGGNVQRPELVEGVTVTRAELAVPYAACSKHIEGLTFGRERADVSEQVDQSVALAECLRDKGFDIDDPTAETLAQWRGDLRVEFDWDDPAALESYETCTAGE